MDKIEVKRAVPTGTIREALAGISTIMALVSSSHGGIGGADVIGIICAFIGQCVDSLRLDQLSPEVRKYAMDDVRAALNATLDAVFAEIENGPSGDRSGASDEE